MGDTISIATAAVTGARHLRMVRNGQDAVAVARNEHGVVLVVADGCGSGASSEVGARLGAELFAAAVAARLPAIAWDAARAEVVAKLAALVTDERVIHDCFLFTLVAVAITEEGAEVWALGDGVYAFDGDVCVLGPFEDNAPPYLGYELLGDRREAVIATAPAGCTSVLIATDGAAEIDISGLPSCVGHPDALRRQLAVLARANERIDWEARRVVREPAVLQDDCAIAIARFGRAT